MKELCEGEVKVLAPCSLLSLVSLRLGLVVFLSHLTTNQDTLTYGWWKREKDSKRREREGGYWMKTFQELASKGPNPPGGGGIFWLIILRSASGLGP